MRATSSSARLGSTLRIVHWSPPATGCEYRYGSLALKKRTWFASTTSVSRRLDLDRRNTPRRTKTML
jgi:hypothetical protein